MHLYGIRQNISRARVVGEENSAFVRTFLRRARSHERHRVGFGRDLGPLRDRQYAASSNRSCCALTVW